MKLKLSKKKIKSLSHDKKAVPIEMTPQVAGGNSLTEWEAVTADGFHGHCNPTTDINTTKKP
ncbi:hypothetical protein H5119_08545 [Pseudoalteromonas sp. SG45-5]|uniref:hypothetical protein n=1 Tax=unclassified Pseudoalteromonas TaxID=194690 RepID=UPI0015FA3CC9|nr:MULTISPECIES: hypothetical protein [unclassified Pseudoalteromonas]MBB1385587.1 hypothetical protein [Pseudoalteromonas sp. SG45-5]MBB1393513.1 hypothetical protein [Pseudoalteromonas sp. SG44-4]MBB1445937.1 hypothetical protein [Pseudoalteromonas sp. SG41-6]